jgi:hypothetical protein
LCNIIYLSTILIFLSINEEVNNLIYNLKIEHIYLYGG